MNGAPWAAPSDWGADEGGTANGLTNAEDEDADLSGDLSLTSYDSGSTSCTSWANLTLILGLSLAAYSLLWHFTWVGSRRGRGCNDFVTWTGAEQQLALPPPQPARPPPEYCPLKHGRGQTVSGWREVPSDQRPRRATGSADGRLRLVT